MKVEKIKSLSEERRRQIMRRSAVDVSDVYGAVRAIIDDVRARGDAANLAQHCQKPGRGALKKLEVSAAEVKEALAALGKPLLKNLETAAANIRAFHAAQLEKPQWEMEVAPGIHAGRKHTPLAKVGCYVPGMRAVYPSTALMAILPAKVAGVGEIVVCTPPDENLRVNPQTIAACHIAGADRIFKLGGPWAIASMAYGTSLVPRVDKIVGPGNKYVAAAKMLVFGQVGIDSPAGPSEALLIADARANPEWLALDFLAQMEHDPDAAAVLVSTSRALLKAVHGKVRELMPTLPRQDILQSGGRYSAFLLADSLDEAIAFSNEYAPEHLQIVTENPWQVLPFIRNAGSIFMGPYAPVAVGDYASGTNHVLPTAGAARMFSGLSVDDFIKKPTYQYLSKQGLAKLAPTVIALAENEGLFVHALSVKKRLLDE